MILAGISTVAIGVAIAGVFASVWPILVRAYCEGRAEKHPKSEFRDTEFGVSLAAYVWPMLLVVIGVWLLCAAAVQAHAQFLAYTIALGTVAAGVFLIASYRNTRVVVSKGWFEYREGKHRLKARLDDIKVLHFVHWYYVTVVIELRNQEQIRVPLHFKESPKLLAMLKYYRPQQDEENTK